MPKKYILHIAQNYSFEILRPLQDVIHSRGDECVWFVGSDNVDQSRFKPEEKVIIDVKRAAEYEADAVFTPGNNVPSFLSGLKVQVFHGLEWKKKGHFRIRDFFDVYCTHGPITTEKFNELADQHKDFLVRETGWPKLDPLFKTTPYEVSANGPVILYAPTFSEKLTSAKECFDEIKALSESQNWTWLVKFHPLMDKDVVEQYKQVESDKLKVVETTDILPLLNRADLMVSDTSSVIGEFLLQGKPVVTFRNWNPEPGLIDISKRSQLKQAIEHGLSRPAELQDRIEEANTRLHPYKDGGSSARILDSVDNILDNNIKPKRKRPLNLFRNLKLNYKLGYWGFK